VNALADTCLAVLVGIQAHAVRGFARCTADMRAIVHEPHPLALRGQWCIAGTEPRWTVIPIALGAVGPSGPERLGASGFGEQDARGRDRVVCPRPPP